MGRRHITSGSRFEGEIGYSRAVLDGDLVFVSGTTGYDYATMTIAPDVVAQCDQAFRNIAAALDEAGAGMADVVRVVFYLPDRADWPPCWPVVKRWLDGARPAATMLVAGLQSPDMKIEVEVTARLRRDEVTARIRSAS
jgi:enamine deaminase RidA (YjgF/YER057c/UK114 family)